MNGLADKQLLELVIMISSAVIYIALHYTCSGLAIAISGQKSGLIRGFLQGVLLCGVFAIVAVFLLNGAVKWYHLISYIGCIWLFNNLICTIIKAIKNTTIKHKQEK